MEIALFFILPKRTSRCFGDNFFEITDNKYCLVHDDGSYDWILRGMEHYKKHLFHDEWFGFWEYGNGGFQVVNKNHKKFFKEMYNINQIL